jgi:hypothetical protein
MNIFVDLANPAAVSEYKGYLIAFQQLANEDSWGIHKLVDCPKQADCILFIDAHVSISVDYYRIVDDHPLTKRYPEKITVYDEYDRPPCYGRGIYVSLPQQLFNPCMHAVVSYWMNKFDTLEADHLAGKRPDYSFFAGSTSYNPTRARLMKQLNNSVISLRDTSAVSPWKTGSDAPTQVQLAQSRLEYSKLMLSHQYCIAPRGNGTSSIRMFEAFAHGTVPIIMSDEYVRPNIDDWNNCVVNVDQRRPLDILALQRQLQLEFERRQELVLDIHNRYFSPRSRWNFMGEQLERVLNATPRWQHRSHSNDLRTKLYWIQHRLAKRIEGKFI